MMMMVTGRVIDSGQVLLAQPLIMVSKCQNGLFMKVINMSS